MSFLPGKGRLLADSEENNAQMANSTQSDAIPAQLPGEGRILEKPKPKESESPESWLDFTKRLGSQALSSAGERIAGLPGDLREGVGGAAIKAYENFGWGLPTQKEMESLMKNWELEPEKQREAPQWLKEAIMGPQAFQDQKSPTSGQIRQGLKQATKGYTEPQNWYEEKLRNFVGDLTDLSIPFPGAKQMSLGRKATVAAGSEFLGDVAQAISGEEKDKYKAKGLSALALSLINFGGARNYVSGLYDEVRQQVPQNARADVAQFVPRLQNFENRTMRSGVHTESTRGVMRDVADTIQMIQDNQGKPPIHALLDLKQRVNENRARFHTTAVTGMERNTGRQLYREFMQEIDGMIDNSLNQLPNIHPRHARDTFREANQGWSTLHDVENSSRFWRKNMPRNMRGTALGAVLEQGFQHPALAAKVGGAALGGMGVILGARVVMQIANSPTLRRYYIDSMRAAAQGNVKLATTLASKLNEEWEKERNQQKSPVSPQKK